MFHSNCRLYENMVYKINTICSQKLFICERKDLILICFKNYLPLKNVLYTRGGLYGRHH